MMLTDNTIAFAKEIFANIKSVEKENAELEEKLLYYGGKLTQCDLTTENLPEEFRKDMYVGIEPDKDIQKPVPLDEAIEILTNKVDYLRESLAYGKKEQEELTSLFNHLTKVYSGILDEIHC